MSDQSSSTAAESAGSAPRTVVGTFTDADLEKATRRAVTRALAEDLGERGDVTSRATVPASVDGEAEVVAREAGVVSGLGAMVEAFAAVDARIRVELHADNGSPVIEDQVIATITGPVRGILAAERTALNFLGHLSGIATATAKLQALIDGTGCQIRDTRKTTPGLRLLEKAAVRDGGGGNHRIGLDDAILVKDNHLIGAGGVGPAVASLREKNPGLAVQVEVEDVDQLREVLDAGITDILLDNFTPDEVRHAVSRVDGRASLEASGNLDASTVREYAEALGEGGRLAVGAITHSAKQLDVALDMVSTESRALVRKPAAATALGASASEVFAAPATTVPVTTPDESFLAPVADEAPMGDDVATPPAAEASADEPSAPEPSAAEPSAAEPSVDESATAAQPAAEASDDDLDAALASLAPPTGDAAEPTRKRRRISSFFSSNDEDEQTGQFDAQAPGSSVTAEARQDDDADDRLGALRGRDEVEVEPSPSEASSPAVPLTNQIQEIDGEPVVFVDPPKPSEGHGLFDAVPAATQADASVDVADELAPLEPLAPLAPLDAVEEPASAALDELPEIDHEAIQDAEVEGAPFSWRQSPFRQRRED